MKKVISLFLTLAMLLSIVSVVDFSAFADVQTGKCGENVTYSIEPKQVNLPFQVKALWLIILLIIVRFIIIVI